jgi:hypothetical protein
METEDFTRVLGVVPMGLVRRDAVIPSISVVVPGGQVVYDEEEPKRRIGCRVLAARVIWLSLVRLAAVAMAG